MKTHKEMKEEYKHLKFRMGVFQIRNIVNNKILIGSNLQLDNEWNSHKFQLNAGMHRNEALQKEWKEFGPENFVYEILEEIKESPDKPLDYKKEIKAMKALYLEKLQPFGEKGYNKL
jgi:hypothetical protein